MLILRKALLRVEIKSNPNWTYVFGDNMIGKGLGGQAKEARGEPNSIGIPTKHLPSTTPESYFTDDDYDKVAPKINKVFNYLMDLLKKGETVVYPFYGVGTGLSKLQDTSPKIYELIQERYQEMYAWARNANKLKVS